MKVIKYLLSILISTSFVTTSAQSTKLTHEFYLKSLKSLNQILIEGGSFKKAIFIVENPFLDSSLNFKIIDSIIDLEKSIAKNISPSKRGKLTPIVKSDTSSFLSNSSLFRLFRDTTIIKTKSFNLLHLPFQFNHSDPAGKEDWTNTFVTKLLATHIGNCKSLSYLYKILADELGAKCWLSLSPRHVYIKNYSAENGWYNTELTSDTFPNNGWIMASGYITMDAIKSGLYMDTLSNQQAIANLAIDLALGYQRKTGIMADSFIINCCDLTLQYHPVNPNALLLKAETMKLMYLAMPDTTTQTAKAWFADMEKVYFKLYRLGYRQMPERMYKAWLKELEDNKKKYEIKLVLRSYSSRQVKNANH